MEDANEEILNDKDKSGRLKGDLEDLFRYLKENKEFVFIHCGGGIQRTGTVMYTLLRWTGLTSKKAFDKIVGMREITGKGLGEWRIRLAEINLV